MRDASQTPPERMRGDWERRGRGTGGEGGLCCHTERGLLAQAVGGKIWSHPPHPGCLRWPWMLAGASDLGQSPQAVFLSGRVSEGGREGPEEEKLWQQRGQERHKS